MYLEAVAQSNAEVERLLTDLSKIPSTTPPSDTKAIVEYVRQQLEGLEGVTIEIVSEIDPIVNIVATVKGYAPGKRLLLNGHLDTFEVVSREEWKHDPFGGEIENRRIFGVGVSDMKAGCASLLQTFILMAKYRNEWKGELILTLVGGEECGGHHGTGYLLKSSEAMRTVDACMIGDVGTSRVIRFGEKGRYRFKLMAHGIPGHGAHMHKTKNAIDMLIDAIVDYKSRVKEITPNCSQTIMDTIKASGPTSESIVGAGETATLLTVTSNIGIFRAGSAPNLVPGYAEVVIDSRFPVGVKPIQIEETLKDLCSKREGITFEKLMSFESLCSDPTYPLLEIMRRNAEASFKAPCVATVRLGGTDAKHVRQYDIPTYSCGCEGGRMGAPDEFVDFDELDHVFEIHAKSAFEFLNS